MTTVLITGCSSDYGLATAHRFHDEVWNVFATMPSPRDVGLIDVLVNNAGIGLVGAFRAPPLDSTRELFEANTFGTIAMTQAVVPPIFARRSGTIVDVTSSVTLTPMPPAAVYTASKMAVEGFTDDSERLRFPAGADPVALAQAN